jgi:methionyl aminopeptidase
MAVDFKSSEDIMLMRESCRLAAQVLDMIEPYVKAGVTTLELNDICHDFIIANNATPSPLNYHGFPKSICTSINEVVCHGIPDDTVCQEGDIINVDITVYKNGFHGDTSRTFFVGEVSEARKKLVETTKECLDAAIAIVKPGIFIGDIGHVIQSIAEPRGYSVVDNYCGHGIGREFHEDPSIVHVGKKGSGKRIEEGMVFTIEPMINIGRHENYVLKDKWTVKTSDGSDSAQFEHTMVVTSYGVDVMTDIS